MTQPTFSTASVPAGTVSAYIGVDTLITEAGGVIGGTIVAGPINVAAAGTTFSGLNPNVTYRIYVVARNGNGPANEYNVATTTQLTSQVPVLNALNISAFSRTTITLDMPTFLTASVPLAGSTVRAYIGPAAGISVTGAGVVLGSTANFDVSGGGCTFVGLTEDTNYGIIVVARNGNLPANEFNTQTIVQRTAFLNVGLVSQNGSITVDGSEYYTAGNSYTSTITVTNNEAAWGSITQVRLNFGPKIIIINNPNGVNNFGLAYVPTAGETVFYTIAGTHDNFVITLTYALASVAGGDVATDIPGAARTITADVTATRYAILKTSSVINRNFGIATDGTKSVGLTITSGATAYGTAPRQYFYSGNTYIFTAVGTSNGHSWACISNVSLTIPRTAGANLLFSFAPNGISGTVINDLNGSGESVTLTYLGNFNSYTITFTYSPNNNTIPVESFGTKSITASVTSAIVGGLEVASQAHDYGLCRRFNFAMVISGGGGVNAPVYIRNIYTPGTSFTLQIQQDAAGVPIDFRQANQISINYNYGGLLRPSVFTLPIVLLPPFGIISSNVVEIQNPSSTEVLAGNTSLPFNAYNIGTISSGAWNSNLAVAFAAQLAVVYASPAIRWDNADPPGVNTTPITVLGIVTPGVDTINFLWTSLIGTGNDADFDSYRIYYRISGAPVWSMIDRNTPVVGAPLGFITASAFTITNLQALTQYDYYLTAIDVFGNESILGAFASSTTLPSSSTETISDGITTYEDSSFTMIPSDRPLRDSSIKIEINVVGASQPDSLNLIFASNAAPNLVAAGVLTLAQNTDYASFNPLTQYFRIETLKTSPNKWVGFISSENPLISPSQDCKFILEAIKGGVPVYYDHSNDINPNNDVWTFTIINPPKVTPWPTRVLNNVITDENPVAYPAYYLTDDATVTITAYDIKGRVVEVLLDNAPRKSGINIRENGWRGTNKAGRKLGVGLYYLHIKAKRQSDGKTIIDKFSKVVMAR